MTYLLTTSLQRTLAKLRVIDFFPHDGFIHIVTELVKALFSKLFLLFHEVLDVCNVLEFIFHLSCDIVEDLEHHGDHNVKNDPLNEDVENHEVDAWPVLTRSIAHHVSHCRPIVDDHK